MTNREYLSQLGYFERLKEIDAQVDKLKAKITGSRAVNMIGINLVNWYDSERENTADEDFAELEIYLDEDYTSFLRYEADGFYVNVLKTTTEIVMKPTNKIATFDVKLATEIGEIANKKRKELGWDTI